MPIFEWDHAKARRNEAKHAVSFILAQRVFDDPFALMLQDRVEAGEERWQAIGRVGEHTVLVVAHYDPAAWRRRGHPDRVGTAGTEVRETAL